MTKKAYLVEVADELYSPIATPDFASDDTFCAEGISKLGAWQARADMWYLPTEKHGVHKADISIVGAGLFAFNEKAVESLGCMLRENGELLMLTADGDNLRVFNPLTIKDCLDIANSQFYIMRRTGEIGTMEKAAIEVKKTDGADIYILPGEYMGWMFVSQAFVDTYTKAELTGLKFTDSTAF